MRKKTANLVFNSVCSGLKDEFHAKVFRYHFGLRPKDLLVNDVTQKMHDIEIGLLQDNVIADIVESPTPGELASVAFVIEGDGRRRWRVGQNTPLSPFSTYTKLTNRSIEKMDKNQRKLIDRVRKCNPRRIVTWRARSIHVDFDILLSDQFSDLRNAHTILHEASHKFCSTWDHAYIHQKDKYKGLNSTLRIRNADCYAFAMMSIAMGELIKDDSAGTWKRLQSKYNRS